MPQEPDAFLAAKWRPMLWPFIHISPFPMLLISRANGSVPPGASKVVCKFPPSSQDFFKKRLHILEENWKGYKLNGSHLIPSQRVFDGQ